MSADRERFHQLQREDPFSAARHAAQVELRECGLIPAPEIDLRAQDEETAAHLAARARLEAQAGVSRGTDRLDTLEALVTIQADRINALEKETAALRARGVFPPDAPADDPPPSML